MICGPRRKKVGRLPQKNHENFPSELVVRENQIFGLKTKTMEEKILFHGSPYHVEELKSSLQTGNIRKGEKSRKGLKDVVFLTTSQNEARNYAGVHGYVYVVRVVKQARQLSTLYGDKSVSIWVAYPEDITIIRVICSDGRIKKPFKKRILLG